MSEALIREIIAKRKAKEARDAPEADMRNSKVIETRSHNGGLTITRRRECSRTGIRYNTIETRLRK